jgi:four helix bundle protein
MERKFDLEERLIVFASLIIEFAEKLPSTFAGKHLAGQIIRSGTAPALHYGEAQSGESRKDFIHKMKTALKELRETYNGLRIIQKTKWIDQDKLMPLLDKNNQLISIFVKSIETAVKNLGKEHRIREKNTEQGSTNDEFRSDRREHRTRTNE